MRLCVLVIVALASLLATVMVPRPGPMDGQAGGHTVVITGPGAPSAAAPALPASAIGDHFYDWSRVVCLSTGGVER